MTTQILIKALYGHLPVSWIFCVLLVFIALWLGVGWALVVHDWSREAALTKARRVFTFGVLFACPVVGFTLAYIIATLWQVFRVL